jgi:O-methyltransferase involved in polyketide biosynthesis
MTITNLHNPDKTESESVELTSIITNRLLRYSLEGKQGFEDEAQYLDAMFAKLQVDDHSVRGLQAMQKFIPRVPSEIFNRHYAIVQELRGLRENGAQTLVVGACGLTPLGVLFSESGNMDVYDTDLEGIVSCRRNINPETNGSYNLTQLDLLDTKKVKEFASQLPKVKTAMLVEGLTLYLDDERRKTFNNNLKEISWALNDNVTFVFDYYVAEKKAGERDTVRNEQDPDWKSFKDLIGNVHTGQKCYFAKRDDVISYLKSEGFKNVRISEHSEPDNAHTIFVADFKPEPYIAIDSIVT